MTHHSASPTCQKKPCLTKNGMFCRREKQAEQKKNKAKRIEEKQQKKEDKDGKDSKDKDVKDSKDKEKPTGMFYSPMW